MMIAQDGFITDCVTSNQIHFITPGSKHIMNALDMEPLWQYLTI